MKRKNPYIALIFTFLAISFGAWAQNSTTLIQRADKLRLSYDFSEASKLYSKALEASEDEAERLAIQEKITWCENGYAMLQYASQPQVVATKTVARKNFFLSYGHLGQTDFKRMEDGQICYFPDGANQLFYCAPDKSGSQSIYESHKVDGTLWSAPTLLNENVTSSQDEAYAMISADGKSLYFSSKGLFGMGGYDLFVSQWDDEASDWGVPENLGFPYSSVADDLMYCVTPDGNYSVFASNRSCSKDSVTIYVLKFDAAPVRSQIGSARDAQRLAALRVINREDAERRSQQKEADDLSAAAADSLFASYKIVLADYNSLNGAIADVQKVQQQTRDQYESTANEDDKAFLAKRLQEAEIDMIELQMKLGPVAERLQALEMDFLMKGIIINPDDLASDRKTSSSDSSDALPEYRFAAGNKTVPFPAITFEDPVQTIDYSFRIEDQALVIDDGTFPEGLVYQIQLFATSQKVAVAKLKGLCPVFERKGASGKYVYTAGVFYKYSEALANLNTVKKRGFSSAIVVAFNNGKSIAVKNARTMESKNKDKEKYRVVFENYEGGIPAALLEIIRSSCSKDLARGTSEGGAPIYYIAPFENRGEAQALVDKLTAAGAEDVKVETIK